MSLYELERRKCKNSFYLGFRRDLLDSMKLILSGIEWLFAQFGLFLMIKGRWGSLFSSILCRICAGGRRACVLDVEVNQVRAQSLAENAQVVLMPGAWDASLGTEQGIQQFVYTHKGDNALTILRDLGLSPTLRRFNKSEWFLRGSQVQKSS